MLVLMRKPGESIVIDAEIAVEVLEVVGNRVRIGIQAPGGVTILRDELLLGDAPDRYSDRRDSQSRSVASGFPG
jgi:carbon storage regulator